MKVIYIEWLDANGTSGMLRRGEIDEFSPLLVCTSGILMGEDEETIKLSQDWWAEPYNERGVYRTVFAVPKLLIKRRLEWETEADRRWTVAANKAEVKVSDGKDEVKAAGS